MRAALPNSYASTRQIRAEYALLIFLTGLFAVRSFLPAWHSLNTDFRNYYIAARLYAEGSSLNRLYDLAWFQRQKDHLGMDRCLVTFIPLTPLSALPMVPLASVSPLAAKRCWLVLNAGLLLIGALLLMQITSLGWRRTFIVIFLAVDPLSTNFLYGQEHLLVFVLFATAVWLQQRGRPATAGIPIALAAGLKLFPLISLAFFLRKKQWRALAGAVAGMLALAGLSVFLFGWEIHRILLREILPVIGRGENIDPYASAWNSLTALLHRLFIREPELNPHPLINSPGLYALVQPLFQAAIFIPAIWLLIPGQVRRGHENLEWAAFLTMLIAFSTNTAPYHLCLLILVAALALDALFTENRQREACILLALYGATCLPWTAWSPPTAEGWRILFASPRVCPMLALLFFLYLILHSLTAVQERLAHRRLETWAFGGLFLVLAAAGALQSFHHLQGEFNNYQTRLFNIPGSLLQGEPAIGMHGVYFTRMPGQAARSEIWNWSGNRLDSLGVNEDAFHPATAPGLAYVWVEVAGRVSNIVRFPTLSGSVTSSSQIEVQNGETPSVSPDGKWLAYIRENHGRGALWIKGIAKNSSSPDGEERRVVDESYDVWEAAISPDDRQVIFAADLTRQPELYSLDLESSAIVKTSLPGPARYPAFSPDGQWLAYSHCERGSWHLYVARVGAADSRQLTGGECRSISPVWEANSKDLIYATDCGRGLEMTALARIPAALTQ